MIYNRFSAPVLFCFLLRLLKGPKPPFIKQKKYIFLFFSFFFWEKQAGWCTGRLSKNNQDTWKTSKLTESEQMFLIPKSFPNRPVYFFSLKQSLRIILKTFYFFFLNIISKQICSINNSLWQLMKETDGKRNIWLFLW